MPRLYLLRHAKAEPAAAGQSDRDRPLAERGRADALSVGAALAAHHEKIALALCSPSLRTRQTFELVAESLDPAPALRIVPGIFAQDDYLEIIRREAGDVEGVLLVGHNPAMRQAASTLAGNGFDAPVRIGESFPTSAVAIFDVDESWSGLRPSVARLVEFRLPRGR